MAKIRDEEGYVIRPNRTAKKKELKAVSDLTKELLQLNDKDLSQISLDAELREQIVITRNMRSNNAKPRQIRFLNNLIAEADYPTIERAVGKLNKGRRSDALQFQELENWRDRLVEEGEAVIPEVVERYAKVDGRELQKFIADIERAKKRGDYTAPARALFRYLKQKSEER